MGRWWQSVSETQGWQTARPPTPTLCPAPPARPPARPQPAVPLHSLKQN